MSDDGNLLSKTICIIKNIRKYRKLLERSEAFKICMNQKKIFL